MGKPLGHSRRLEHLKASVAALDRLHGNAEGGVVRGAAH